MLRHRFNFVSRSYENKGTIIAYKNHRVYRECDGGETIVDIFIKSKKENDAWKELYKIKFALSYVNAVSLNLSDYKRVNSRGGDYEGFETEIKDELTLLEFENKEHEQSGSKGYLYYKEVFDSLIDELYVSQTGIFLSDFYKTNDPIQRSINGFKIIELLFRKDFDQSKLSDSPLEGFCDKYSIEEEICEMLKEYRDLRNSLFGHGSFDEKIVDVYSPHSIKELERINSGAEILKKYIYNKDREKSFDPIDERQNDILVRYVVAKVLGLPFFRIQFPTCNSQIEEWMKIYDFVIKKDKEKEPIYAYVDF